MTPWASQVNPKHPWPDYPRPQMVRTDWMNLNGIWQYQPGQDGDAVPTRTQLSSEILVPYPVESALSGVMEHHDRLWYRRSFVVPAAWKGRRDSPAFRSRRFRVAGLCQRQKRRHRTGAATCRSRMM